MTRNFCNLFFVFLLSGFWHGANWTFVIWGGLHGTYLIVERLAGLAVRRFWPDKQPHTPSIVLQSFKLVLTFHLVLLAWVFFRADSLATAGMILRKIALDHGPVFWDPAIVQALLATALLLVLDVFNRRLDYWDNQDRFHVGFRIAYAVGLIFAVVLFGTDTGTQFIYFQF